MYKKFVFALIAGLLVSSLAQAGNGVEKRLSEFFNSGRIELLNLHNGRFYINYCSDGCTSMAVSGASAAEDPYYLWREPSFTPDMLDNAMKNPPASCQDDSLKSVLVVLKVEMERMFRHGSSARAIPGIADEKTREGILPCMGDIVSAWYKTDEGRALTCKNWAVSAPVTYEESHDGKLDPYCGARKQWDPNTWVGRTPPGH